MSSDIIKDRQKSYFNGYRVGLATHDVPVTPNGTVVQTIKAIERFVEEAGPLWEYGFWNGVEDQPQFEYLCKAA